jgi:hypothetical protein
MISKTIDVVVTSVLQTTAGKMIFGRYIEPGVAPTVPAAAPAPSASQAPAPVAGAERTARDETARARVRNPQPQQT